MIACSAPTSTSCKVRWVKGILQPHKALLNAPRRHEPVEDRDAASLVIRPTRARATKRLLPDHRARALLVVVHVPRRVAQRVGRVEERLPVRSEAIQGRIMSERQRRRSRDVHGSGQRIDCASVDELERLVIVAILVDIGLVPSIFKGCR